MTKPAYESLHNHTVFSDGELTHLELLGAAEGYGFGVIAFTDHDVLPDERTLKELAAYEGPVKWILGCEISSGLPKELGGGATGGFHVLGLFTDPMDRPLSDYFALARDARIKRVKGMVKNLQRIGFDITIEEVMTEAGENSVGSPHIARVIGKHEKNESVTNELLNKMRVAAEKDPDLMAKYNALTNRGPEQYPYALYLSENSFVQEVYVHYKHSVDMDSAVGLIRGAGGVAIVAHWTTVMEKVDEVLLKKFLKEKRLDGVEISYPARYENPEAQDILRKIIDETGCLVTYGADIHTESDFKYFAGNTKTAEQSVGITEKLIDRVRPSLKYSNWNRK